MKTVLSGISPSGTMHIGNYLGAVKPLAELQKNRRVFAMIADLHALTVPREPHELRQKIMETAKLLVACGIEPKKSTLFLQSGVPAHAELCWLLGAITPLGELERMTQFKEKKEKAGLLAGLLNYPVLQAADILLYLTDAVPVGEDQLQHLELARSLARKFNSRFGKTFKIPAALTGGRTARLMGLDDPSKKMSKSAANPENYVALLDSAEEIRRKIKIAVTDSGREIRYDEKSKPAVSNLMNIFSSFSGLAVSEIEKRYRGQGYAEFKKDLAELLVKELAPLQKKFRGLSERLMEEVLKKGAEKAGALAQKTIKEAKQKIGLPAF